MLLYWPLIGLTVFSACLYEFFKALRMLLGPESNERDRNVLLPLYNTFLFLIRVFTWGYFKTRRTAVSFLNQRKVAAITGLWCP